MNVRYRISRTARGDLKRIAEFWTGHATLGVATNLIMGIVESVIALSTQPQSGVKRPEFGSDVRMFPTGRFLMYYRHYRGGIQVIHVFDGSQDQQAAWKGTKPSSS